MKNRLFIMLLGFIVLVVAACGNTDEADEEKGDQDGKEAEPITVEHELGTTEVEKNPGKVVVFDFGTLDTLDKLGVDVVGVPQNNIPSYLDKYEGDDYENVGSLKEPDFEKIAEIDPDLIIISGRQSEVYDELEELADTIYLGVDTTRYMDSFKENLAVIGEVFDKEDEVAEEQEQIEDAIASLQEKAEASEQTGLIILANDDKISAYGPNSRFGIIHDVFGVEAADEDIEASTHGMNVSFEYVVEKDPDLLYVVDRSAAIGEESSAKKIVENELIKETKVYEDDNITYLDPEYWYLSGGGLVSVTEMIEEIDASLE
ncbi:MAG TPA: siderophore ABC transporter substrate-binding protein [Virgibacillus sp.]|nr:siderophore ABC transporter substrate-binding protein [Virgibacillus sp.]